MNRLHQRFPLHVPRKSEALRKADLAGSARALAPETVEGRTHADASLRRHLLVGAAAVALLVGGLGTWAATTELSGAVIVSGNVVVESNVKDVQHPTGGVVGVLNVRNGAYVEAGSVLVKLDDTLTRSNLAVVTKSLDELAAREARLVSEGEGLGEITFDADLA
ncbi:MAG: HlyD family type I secretion periplasmic adaptor subunit, partial [Aliihoeflea sp.]